ncbi:MAG TPA: CDGSH iron-sulfur domain-containing protein [Nocardioidaceae bacterium]|nr:CDGSH iron-sulfur domain-containing protein [Nocardioidaceae bacterium]
MDSDHRPTTARPVTIKAVQNGPLQLKGDFKLVSHEGEEYDLAGQRIVLLCRCGRSGNQPFCDSTHKEIGFVSEDRPACAIVQADGAA